MLLLHLLLGALPKIRFSYLHHCVHAVVRVIPLHCSQTRSSSCALYFWILLLTHKVSSTEITNLLSIDVCVCVCSNEEEKIRTHPEHWTTMHTTASIHKMYGKHCHSARLIVCMFAGIALARFTFFACFQVTYTNTHNECRNNGTSFVLPTERKLNRIAKRVVDFVSYLVHYLVVDVKLYVDFSSRIIAFWTS